MLGFCVLGIGKALECIVGSQRTLASLRLPSGQLPEAGGLRGREGLEVGHARHEDASVA